MRRRDVQATGFGAVPYAYNIGTYDVTNSQYVEFLNAKDPTGDNPLGLYNSNMSDATLWWHQLQCRQCQRQQVQRSFRATEIIP